jgi:hypothetical protein
MGRLTRCLSFICCIGFVNVWKLNISKKYFGISSTAFVMFQHLVEILPRRVEAVTAAKGGPTPYKCP